MKTVRKITYIFNLFVAVGALATGLMMIRSFQVFSTFPMEWMLILPLNSWQPIGAFIFVVFGLGNLIAFVMCIKNKNLFTVLMSVILILALTMQIILFKELYLATVEFMIVGIIQLVLGLILVRRRSI